MCDFKGKAGENMKKFKSFGFYTMIMSWYYSLKYRKLFITLIVMAVIAMLVFGGFYLSDYLADARLRKFTFTPEACQNFFGGTPEEIASKSLNSQDKYVDKNGNYVITMSEASREILLATYRSHIKNLESQGVDILVNGTAIVIDANKLIEFNVKQGSPWGIYECAEIQMLNGFDPDEIKVRFTAKNFETGEVVYSAVWPQDVIRFTYETENGSYTYGIDGCTSIIEVPK